MSAAGRLALVRFAVELDDRAEPRDAAQAAISGDERRGERFGEGEISSVVGGHVCAQPPHLLEKRDVWVTHEPKTLKPPKGTLEPRAGHKPTPLVASEHMHDIEVEEVRCM